MIEQVRNAFQVVVRREHQTAGLSQSTENRGELPAGILVESGKGLVEQDDVRLLRERPGDKSALLLAAGERADLAVGEGIEIHRRERLVHRAGVRRAKGAPQAKPHVAPHSHQGANRDGEIPIDLLALRQVRRVVLALTALVAVKINRAGLDGQEAGQRLEQRGLARPVRAEQGDAMTARQIEIQVMQRRNPMIGNRQVTDFEAVVRHGVSGLEMSGRCRGTSLVRPGLSFDRAAVRRDEAHPDGGTLDVVGPARGDLQVDALRRHLDFQGGESSVCFPPPRQMVGPDI